MESPMEEMKQSERLGENYRRVKENIRKACETAGRNEQDVTLLAVSKTKPVDMLLDVYQAGAREVSIIEEPIAAAIGAGIDISKPCGNMIVDIGGGTADIAVISLGGTVVSASIKIAGDDFDEALVRHMRKKHNLLIGERTAEDLKIKIGSCYKRAEVDYMDVRGRNLVTGLPKTVKVSSEETEEALRETTAQIVETIHSVLEKTPPAGISGI